MVFNVRNKSLTEVIEEAANLESKSEQVKFLKEHTTPEMEWYVDRLYNYDNSIFVVPHFEYNKRDSSICYFDLKKAEQYINIIETMYSQDKHRKAEDKMYMMLTELPADDARLILDMFKGESLIDKGVWAKVCPQFFLIHEETPSTETDDEADEEKTNQ